MIVLYLMEHLVLKNMCDFLLVDFSKAKFHDVVGFDLIPVMFPALSEPISTTQQYLEFADLMNATNKELEEFLVVYGGYKAYLESQIADAQAKKNALNAALDEL